MNIIRRAFEGPSNRSALLAPPRTPTLISVSPNVAFSPAMTRSQTPTRPKPAPIAACSTAPITGTRHSRIAYWVCRHSQAGSRRAAGRTWPADPSEDSSFKSIPPQKARSPLAASTTAATLRSWDNSSKQARSSRIMALLTALTGGRAKCTTATPSFFSSSRVSMSCALQCSSAPRIPSGNRLSPRSMSPTILELESRRASRNGAAFPLVSGLTLRSLRRFEQERDDSMQVIDTDPNFLRQAAARVPACL